MNIELLQSICKKLPGVTEDIKWGNDLCFSVATKMFCVAGLAAPLTVSFKVKDEEFNVMTSKDGIVPAPYVARYKWILVENVNVLTKKEWEFYVQQSYSLIKNKLPKKLLKDHNLL